MPGQSVNEMQAVMTTAPSAACGMSFTSPGASNSSSAITPAPTKLASCVCAPALAATGVRELLLLIGKPCISPAAMLALPSASISWSGSTRVPLRLASARDSTLVSANASSAMMAAPGASTRRSSSVTVASGSVGTGRPCGTGPITSSPAVAPRSNSADTVVASTTAMSTPGHFGRQRRTPRISARQATPMAMAAGLPRPSTKPRTISHRRGSEPFTVVEKPISLGNWLIITVSAMALKKPSRIGLENKSAITPSRAKPISSKKPPVISASTPARATARSTLPPASGRIRLAMTAANVESGPSTMMRLGPSSAYTSSGTMVAYKPWIAGTPAASA